MKKRNSLLLNDFLETNNLEDCKSPCLELAIESIMDGNTPPHISYHLDNLLYEVFETIPRDNQERHLLRFTSFPPQKDVNGNELEWDESRCPIIKDIKNNTITLSSPKGFNDPMDPSIKIWIEGRKHGNKIDRTCYRLLEKSLDNIRICCLVDQKLNRSRLYSYFNQDKEHNPLMWAHYADSHKGVCIQYKITPSNLKDTKERVVRLLDVDYSKSFSINAKTPFIDSLVVKSKYWQYEKETRLVMYSRKEEEKYCQLPNFEIEAVYMGYKINHKQRDCLKRLLGASSIRLYQMGFFKNDIAKMDAHEITLK